MSGVTCPLGAHLVLKSTTHSPARPPTPLDTRPLQTTPHPLQRLRNQALVGYLYDSALEAGVPPPPGAWELAAAAAADEDEDGPAAVGYGAAYDDGNDVDDDDESDDEPEERPFAGVHF